MEALANDKEQQAIKLGPIRDLEKKIEEEGIESNRHTSLNAKDVEIQYEGFNLLLARKSEMLRELIELSKLRGVSAEEWDEFNNNFKKFDKNADSFLDGFFRSFPLFSCLSLTFFSSNRQGVQGPYVLCW